MSYLGYTYPKQLSVVYLKFSFNWAACILPGNPTRAPCSVGTATWCPWEGEPCPRRGWLGTGTEHSKSELGRSASADVPVLPAPSHRPQEVRLPVTCSLQSTAQKEKDQAAPGKMGKWRFHTEHVIQIERLDRAAPSHRINRMKGWPLKGTLALGLLRTGRGFARSASETDSCTCPFLSQVLLPHSPSAPLLVLEELTPATKTGGEWGNGVAWQSHSPIPWRWGVQTCCKTGKPQDSPAWWFVKYFSVT